MPMIAPGARQPAIRRLWPWAVLVTAAVLLWRLFQSPDGQAESPTALPVAGVVAATTQRRDVHVEIKGIGLVQAYNTVTVKPRINGRVLHRAEMLGGNGSEAMVIRAVPESSRVTRSGAAAPMPMSR
jgi:hypothetical protein